MSRLVLPIPARRRGGGVADSSARPVHDPANCANCMMCWLYCPKGAILVANQQVTGIDQDTCSGCGTCVSVCPPKRHAMTWSA